MKNQALFSLKNKSKQLNSRLLQFLYGVLRVNSFSVISGRWMGDNVRLCAMEICIRLKRYPPPERM